MRLSCILPLCFCDTFIGTRFEVEGFPTLKWFVNGKPQEYNGGRVTKDIVSWIVKHTGPAYKTINSNAELAAEIEAAKSSPVVVAVLADHSGKAAQEFFTAAQDDTSGAVFLVTFPGSVTDGVPATDAIVMKVALPIITSPFSPTRLRFHAYHSHPSRLPTTAQASDTFEQISGRSDESLPVNDALQAKAINDWISVYSLPLVVPFSQVCAFCSLCVLFNAAFPPGFLIAALPQDTQSAIFGSPVKTQLLAFIEPKKVLFFA